MSILTQEFDDQNLTRDAAGIQAWFAATQNQNTGRHGRLILRRKIIRLTDTLTIAYPGGGGSKGGIIDCEDVTFMVAFDDATKPAIRFDRCDGLILRGANFDTEGGDALACVAYYDSGAGAIRSNRCRAEYCSLDDTNGKIKRFVKIERTGDAAKNDHHKFIGCRGQDYGHSFAQIANPAAVCIVFEDCEMQGRSNGQYGVYNKDDDNANGGGQFEMRGGIAMEHQVASFRSAHRTGTCLVQKVQTEQDAMTLIVDDAGAAVNINAFTLENCRLGYDAALQPVDKNVIEVDSGVLRVIGCHIGSLVTPTLEHLIAYNCPAAERQGWSLHDSTVHSIAPATTHWATGQAPTSKINSWRWDGTNYTAL